MGGERDGERWHNKMDDGGRRRWNEKEKDHLSMQSAVRAFTDFLHKIQEGTRAGKSGAKDPA